MQAAFLAGVALFACYILWELRISAGKRTLLVDMACYTIPDK